MDATATSGGEIGRAMQKVAGQAGALGIPFEKIASYIAVISSRTRESAESIGTSMKSLLARFQNITETGFNEEDETKINDVAKALNSVGIAFTDVNGEIRRFDVVIEELGTKWDKLDSTTQAYLATTLSGARQQSRFYNLMDGLQEATKLYNNSLLATTTTQDKFNVYLESNEAKLNTFKARMEEMWLNTFNDQNLGKIIEFGTSIVSLIDNIGLLNLAVVAAGTAFIIYLDKINKAILAVKALNPEIAIAVSVIGALMFAIGKYNEHQQKMYDNAVKNAQALSEESRKSTDLLNSISNLYDKQKLSND
jgi:TP901 family phage tail tape measure protein